MSRYPDPTTPQKRPLNQTTSPHSGPSTSPPPKIARTSTAKDLDDRVNNPVTRRVYGHTDEEYIKLDNKIFRHFKANVKIDEMPDPDDLLSTLTFQDDKLKTLSEEEAEELIAEFPTLKEHLENAWHRRSLKETRQLGASRMTALFYFLNLNQQFYGLKSRLNMSL